MRYVKMLFLQVLFAAVLSGGSLAQKNFEGIVELNYSGDRGDNTIKYYTKNGMVRLEMGNNAKIDEKSPKTGTILLKNNTLYILMPERKAYIEKPLNIKDQLEKLGKKSNVEKGLKKTGEQKDILGYKADQWTLKNEKGEVEVWSTTELGNILQGLSGINREKMPQWLKDIAAQDFFPLLLIQHNTDGKEINRLEVKNIDKKNLEESLFEVPGDYKKAETQRRQSGDREQSDRSKG